MRYLVTNDYLISADCCDSMPLDSYDGTYGEEVTYYFIVSACNGRRNNAYGFCWQYVDK